MVDIHILITKHNKLIDYIYLIFIFVCRSLEGHESSVTAVAFSPDSSYVVSGSMGGDMRVWDARYGHGKNLFFMLDAHDLGMTCCEFSPTYGSAGETPGM